MNSLKFYWMIEKEKQAELKEWERTLEPTPPNLLDYLELDDTERLDQGFYTRPDLNEGRRIDNWAYNGWFPYPWGQTNFWYDRDYIIDLVILQGSVLILDEDSRF